MTLNLTPKAGMVLVRPILSRPDASPSGLIQLADVYEDSPTTGEVVGLAESYRCGECGAARESDVQRGDIVLFPPSAGTRFEFDGAEYLSIPEAEIQAIVWAAEQSEVA